LWIPSVFKALLVHCLASWRVFVVAENAFIFGLAYFFLPDDEKALA
jgi:hypothetical protein